jgi:hypothetical protein
VLSNIKAVPPSIKYLLTAGSVAVEIDRVLDGHTLIHKTCSPVRPWTKNVRTFGYQIRL